MNKTNLANNIPFSPIKSPFLLVVIVWGAPCSLFGGLKVAPLFGYELHDLLRERGKFVALGAKLKKTKTIWRHDIWMFWMFWSKIKKYI